MRCLPALMLLSVLLWGCGYRPPGEGLSPYEGVHVLQVEQFANRTFEPFLEVALTNEVIKRFSRSRTFSIDANGHQAAEGVLAGSIEFYSTDPISYDRNDDILEYRSRMIIEALLRRRSDGRVLWKGRLEWTEEYPASEVNILQEEREAAAIDIIAARLAEELFVRIADDF